MKKLFLLVLILAVSTLVWFLFIKKYDYQFHFKTLAGMASTYEEIKGGQALGLFNEQGIVTTEEEFPFSHLVQNVTSGDTILSMEWRLEYENDSVTRVKVRTLNNEHKLKNRLAILNPFRQSEYVFNLAQKLSKFKQRLDLKQGFYAINIEEISKSPELTCICTTSTNIGIKKKALEMMEKIEIIESYLVQYNLKLNGYPFLKVTDWDISKEKINFDFCFPLDIPEGLEETELVKIKNYPGQESLKGIFNGNYRESHLAWYELLAKARRDDIAVEQKPLEIYFNDPRMGENAIEWKAEVFMPLDKK